MQDNETRHDALNVVSSMLSNAIQTLRRFWSPIDPLLCYHGQDHVLYLVICGSTFCVAVPERQHQPESVKSQGGAQLAIDDESHLF